MKRKQPDDVVDTAAVQRQQEPAAARAPRELSVDEATAACDPEFWLSCVHDTRCDRRKSGCDLMTFSAMVHDKLRMRSYERDIWATVRGKRVLEVGTGALAPLTQMCLAAGATEVVTVERSPWAAEAAAELLVPHRNCRVITGDATALTVADTGGEGRFDVLVHGKLSRSLGFTRTCATHTTRHYTHQGFHYRFELRGVLYGQRCMAA
jgi:protein-L-isoaspartate O-methyltransferase